MDLAQLPARLATGAFIAHSGWDKWRADEATAEGVHAMAAGTYPVVKTVPPTRFLRLLAAGEMAVGTALLAPVVPAAMAGATLTAFSAALLGLYARTPGLRKPGSIWPTQQGTPIAKDVWMLGIGLSLLGTARTSRHAPS